MEKEIKKLIAEYEKKIASVDVLIELVKTEIEQARSLKIDYAHLRLNQTRLFAQLNAHHQAQADFDSLLDYV